MLRLRRGFPAGRSWLTWRVSVAPGDAASSPSADASAKGAAVGSHRAELLRSCQQQFLTCLLT